MSHRPPSLARHLLEVRLPENQREFLLGDLEERFHSICSERGASAARRWYWWQAARAAFRRWPRIRGPRQSWVQGLGRDARHSLRVLSRAPLFSALVVLTFAIGIGAAGAMFSVLDPILLQGAPYPDARNLLLIFGKEKDGTQSNIGYLTFRDIERDSRTLESSAVMSYWTPILGGRDDATRLTGQRVTHRFFSTLGVQPALGRDFRPEEDNPDLKNSAVILSHGLWQSALGGDSSIIGKTITLSERQVTVIGVMPRSFESLLSPTAQLWAPLGYSDSDPWACRDCQHLRMIGRVREGTSRGAVAEEMDRLSAEMVRLNPTSYPVAGMILNPINDYVTRSVRPVLLAITGAVALLLLIACVNVTNLFLGRALERSGEFAVRSALGAGSVPLVRQVLTEGITLALVGGLLGAGLAWAGVRLLLGMAPTGVPRIEQVAVNGTAVLFMLLIATAAGLVAALAPALAALRSNLATVLRSGGRAIVGMMSRRLRAGLVVIEVAVALVLLAGTGLLLRSLDQLLKVEPGFRPDGLVTLELETYGGRYSEDAAVNRFFGEVIDRVRAIPGVTDAAVVSQLPLSGDFDSWGVHLESRPSENPMEDPSAFRFSVSPGYLETMGIPLVRGRQFTEEDRAGAPLVVLINSAMARRVFANEEPIGQRIRIGGPDGPWRTIVGVVGDVRHQGLDASDEQQFYMPATQGPWADSRQILVVRTGDRGTEGPGDRGTRPGDRGTEGLVPAIRAAIREVDPGVPIATVATMGELIRRNAATRLFALAVFQAFAAVALLLAALGLYGVLAASVTERTREIGIRSALGAGNWRLLKLVVNDALRLTVLGLCLGAGGALVLSRLLTSLLYGVSATDGTTFGTVGLLLLIVALVAASVPAWRAVRVDPVEALRE